MEPSLRPATRNPADADAFARLADAASGGTFRLLLGRRSRDFLRSAFLEPGHELGFPRVTFVVADETIAGMLVAADGRRRATESKTTRQVVLRHAGWALPRMAIVALLLAPALRAQEQVEENDYYVQMVAVEPRWRRSGLGRFLMGHAEQQAKARGCARIALDVEATNVPAITLYRSLGYQDVFTSGRPWLINKPPTIRMAKAIE